MMESCSWLLQLPDVPLALVLLQLDLASLASVAISCSTLRRAVPGNVIRVALYRASLETLDSFTLWHDQHRTKLTNLRKCTIDHIMQEPCATVRQLPLPKLDCLFFRNVTLQLGPSADFPGVLHDCTGLTALCLTSCTVQDPHAVVTAIGALRQLQDLALETSWDGLGQAYFADLQHPQALTCLSLDCGADEAEELPELRQLSAFSNLSTLTLSEVHNGGIPGGLPSQLVRLTSLSISYSTDAVEYEPAEQWQHLSSFTELQVVRVRCGHLAAHHLRLEHLSQLRVLKLKCGDLRFDASSTQKWSGLTALHSLTLWECAVEPKALAAFTQLRTLDLAWNRGCVRSLAEVFIAVGKLPLLEQLDILSNSESHFPPAAFAALTASSKLQSLTLRMAASTKGRHVEPSCALFTAGEVYPDLRKLDLQWTQRFAALPVSPEHLRLLSECCPAVEDLSFTLGSKATPTALLPLQQLTFLKVDLFLEPSSTAAVVKVAAQLTTLKGLALLSMPTTSSPTLLKLSALTALDFERPCL